MQDDSRQAGAELGSPYCQQAGGLRFESKDDALAFANDIAERGRSIATEWGVSFAQDYFNGVINIHLEVSAGADTRIFKFIGGSTPFIDKNFDRPNDIKIFVGDEISHVASQRKLNNAGVFICGEFTGDADYIVPTVVRLARPDEIQNVSIDLLASVLDCDLEIGGVPPHREIDTFGIFPPGSESRVANGLVKRVAGIRNYAHGPSPKDGGRSLRESQGDDLFAGLWIISSNDFVLAYGDERFASRFKIDKVFPSRFDCG